MLGLAMFAALFIILRLLRYWDEQARKLAKKEGPKQ